MEEYVQTQERNRLMTIPEDSTLSPDLSYRRKSRSPSYPSPKPVPDDRISFEPLAESKSKRSSWDAISLKSADSIPASIRTSTSVLPQLPTTSPAPSRTSDGSKDKNVTVERARAPWHVVSDDSGEDYLAAPKSTAETRHIPEVFVHPPATDAYAPGKPALGPITLTSSVGSSQIPEEKPKRVMNVPNAIRSSRRSRKIQEQKERQLRHEYDAKSMYLASLPSLFVRQY
jgi:hypothetical protein